MSSIGDVEGSGIHSRAQVPKTQMLLNLILSPLLALAFNVKET